MFPLPLCICGRTGDAALTREAEQVKTSCSDYAFRTHISGQKDAKIEGSHFVLAFRDLSEGGPAWCCSLDQRKQWPKTILIHIPASVLSCTAAAREDRKGTPIVYLGKG